MGNLIFKILSDVIFILLCSVFTMFIGNIILFLLGISYFLTYAGSVGITLGLVYMANMITMKKR